MVLSGEGPDFLPAGSWAPTLCAYPNTWTASEPLGFKPLAGNALAKSLESHELGTFLFFTGRPLNRYSVQPVSPFVKAKGIPSVSFSLREVNSLKHRRTGGWEGHPEGWWLLLAPRRARHSGQGKRAGLTGQDWVGSVAPSSSSSLRSWTNSASPSLSAEQAIPSLPQDLCVG